MGVSSPGFWAAFSKNFRFYRSVYRLPYFSKIYRSGVVYNKKSPDSPALSQFQLSAIRWTHGDSCGGLGLGRPPRWCSCRLRTWDPPRSVDVCRAAWCPSRGRFRRKGERRGREGGKVSSLRGVFFFWWDGGGSVGWFFSLFSGNLMEKKQA